MLGVGWGSEILSGDHFVCVGGGVVGWAGLARKNTFENGIAGIRRPFDHFGGVFKGAREDRMIHAKVPRRNLKRKASSDIRKENVLDARHFLVIEMGITLLFLSSHFIVNMSVFQ